MSTFDGAMKTLSDSQLRFSTTGALTVLGAAQNKGTATDLYLVLLVGPDGGNAVGGTTNVVVQGSNVTASASSNWVNVVADKGPFCAARGRIFGARRAMVQNAMPSGILPIFPGVLEQ